MKGNEPRRISKIYLHTSVSGHGDAKAIDEWHSKQWGASPSGKFIGYHFVVLNGRRRGHGEYVGRDDGLVEVGRPLNEVGAHVLGDNTGSIGVCLIGRDGLYTVAQIRKAVQLVRDLCDRYCLTWASVFCHYQAPTAKKQGKTCPDFDVDVFRALLRGD